MKTMMRKVCTALLAIFILCYGIQPLHCNTAEAATELSKPSNLTATSIRIDTIRLNWQWTSADVIDGFKVYRYYRYRRRGRRRWGSELVATTVDTEVTITGLTPGTGYYYAVSAYKAAEESSGTDLVYIAVGFPAPSNPTTTKIQSDTIRVNWQWEYIDSTEGFKVYRCYTYRRGGKRRYRYDRIATIPDPTTRSYDVTGLSSGTYNFCVSAYNGPEESDYSDLVSAEAGLPIPQNLTAATTSSYETTLSWDCANLDQDGFKIYSCYTYKRKGKRRWRYEHIATVTDGSARSFVVGNLPSGGTYLCVSSYKGTIGSASLLESNRSELVYTVIKALPTPTDLNATASLPGRIGFSWMYYGLDQDGFKIYRCYTYRRKGKRRWGYNLIATIADPSARNYSIIDSTPGEERYYSIRAYKYSRESDNSNKPYLVTDPPGSGASVSARVQDVINTRALSPFEIELNWADNSTGQYSEFGFEIYRSEGYGPDQSSAANSGADGAFSYLNSVPRNTTSYMDQGLAPETTYWYKVRAVNNWGASEFTIPVRATTLSARPNSALDFKITEYDEDKVKLQWQPNLRGSSVFRAINMWLERKEITYGQNTGWIQIDLGDNLSRSSHTDNQIDPGATYLYRICKRNGYGDSYTDPIEVTTGSYLPDPPLSFAIRDYDERRIKLEWDPNLRSNNEFKAIHLYVERKRIVPMQDTNWSVRFQYNDNQVNIVSCTDNQVDPGATYQYRIRKENGYQISNGIYANVFSDPLEATAGSPTPNPALELKVCPIEWNDKWRTVKLEWDPNLRAGNGFRATNMRVERRKVTPTQGANWTQIEIGGSLSKSSYTDNQVNPGTTYLYRIWKHNGYGNSYSNEITVVTETPLPNPPLDLSLDPNDWSDKWRTAKLVWDPNPRPGSGFEGEFRATNMRVERKLIVPGQETGWIQIETGGGLSKNNYTDNQLEPGSKYLYRIYKHNGYGNIYSDPIEIGTESPLPNPALDLTIDYYTHRKVRFLWDPNPRPGSGFEGEFRATNMRLERKQIVPEQDMGWIQIEIGGSLSKSSYTDNQVNPGATYLYRIYKHNGYGDVYSNAVEVTTGLVLPDPAIDLKITDYNERKVKLEWAPNLRSITEFRAIHLYVERKAIAPMQDANWRILFKADDNNVDLSSYTDNQTIPGTTYLYRIRKENGYQISAGLYANSYTDPIELTVGSFLPNQPLDFEIERYSEREVKVKWGPNLRANIGSEREFRAIHVYVERKQIAPWEEDGWNQIYASNNVAKRNPDGFTRFTDNQTDPGATYLYRIRKENGYQISAGLYANSYTDPIEVTAGSPLPKPPLDFAIEYYDEHKVRVSWKPNLRANKEFRAIHVHVERKLISDTYWSQVLSTSNVKKTDPDGFTRFTDNQVDTGETYIYRICKENGYQISNGVYCNSYSDPIEVTTGSYLPNLPLNAEIESYTNRKVTFKWEPNLRANREFRAIHVYVERKRISLAQDVDWKVIFKYDDDQVGRSSCTDNQVDPGTTYQYRIRKENGYQISNGIYANSYSDPIEVTTDIFIPQDPS